MSAPASGEPRLGRWQELTKSECFELLANEHLGRVAVVDDRGPVVFPVNFVLDRHTVVFRTEEGTKLQALEGANTSFQVHLQVAPGKFTRIYNAVQLATAPALAAAGNAGSTSDRLPAPGSTSRSFPMTIHRKSSCTVA